GLSWEVAANLGKGRLIYNHQYKRWSLPYRPDYLWHPGRGSDIALDAKFRLEARSIHELDDSRGVDAQTVDEATRSATPKAEDITKMHAYRDALGVQAAIVVYPGDESVFFEPTGQRNHPTLDHLLERSLAGDLEGVGAVPLTPMEDTQP